MIAAGHVDVLRLAGLKPQRAPVLAGGFAIMLAALAELDVARINPVGGALRLGVLYDLLGRSARRDARVATVERFLERYRVDRPHAERVSGMARMLYEQAPAGGAAECAASASRWAALLHEVGYTVSHIGFHKHGAYILRQRRHAGLLGSGPAAPRDAGAGLPRRLVQDGGDARRRGLPRPAARAALAVLFHHARRAIDAPRIELALGKSVRFGVAPRWLAAHPLTAHLLEKERPNGRRWAIPGR